MEAYWLRKKEQVWLAISSANWLQQKLLLEKSLIEDLSQKTINDIYFCQHKASEVRADMPVPLQEVNIGDDLNKQPVYASCKC